MRTRWMLAASILFLMLLPAISHAGSALGSAPPPVAAVAATATASAPATPALPVWAVPAQPSAQETDRTPLFLASCSGCTPAACQRLHSCVLLHCC